MHAVHNCASIFCGLRCVQQDDYSYPILHDRDGQRSEHLDTAKSFYDRVRLTGADL